MALTIMSTHTPTTSKFARPTDICLEHVGYSETT